MRRRIVTTLHCLWVTLGYILLVFGYALRFRDAQRRWFYSLARRWAKKILSVAQVDLHVEGQQYLPSQRPVVYIANHSSYMDIPILLAALPGEVVIVYKRELESVPLFGWMLRLSPFIAIDRRNPRRALTALHRAFAAVHAQQSLLIFPEGTRSSDGRLQPFRRGAFLLAFQAALPVVPVAIVGAFELLPRSRYTIAPGKKIVVRIGKPLEVPTQRTRAQEKQIMHRAYTAVEQMLNGVTNISRAVSQTDGRESNES